MYIYFCLCDYIPWIPAWVASRWTVTLFWFQLWYLLWESCNIWPSFALFCLYRQYMLWYTLIITLGDSNFYTSLFSVTAQTAKLYQTRSSGPYTVWNDATVCQIWANRINPNWPNPAHRVSCGLDLDKFWFNWFALVWHVDLLWAACGLVLANGSGSPKCHHSMWTRSWPHVMILWGWSLQPIPCTWQKVIYANYQWY